MNDVIQLQDYKPHATGPCKCSFCGEKYVGVMPIPLNSDQGYECPACGRFFGFLEYPISGKPEDEIYVCNKCDGSFFSVHRDGIICGICGTKHLNVLKDLNAAD